MKHRFRDMRVLAAGGAGFVGSNLCRRLLDLEVERLLIVDNLLSADAQNIPDSRRINFRQGSIADDHILAEIDDEYDYVFHLATYHGNQSSIHDPLADHDNNLLTTLKLFFHLRNFRRLKKVVYAGAGCAVAAKTDKSPRPVTEEDPLSLEMDSPYSISKLVGEFYARYFFKQHRLPVVTARFQNVYGPGEILGAGQWRGTSATVWRNVTPTFIYKALKQEALPVENEGRSTRDFIFVGDIVEGLLRCAAKGEAGQTYNLASGIETSIRDLAEHINSLTENPAPIKLLPKRAWDRSGRRVGSTIKASKYLGFTAKTELNQGLELTIQWTRNNLRLIEKTIAQHKRYMEGQS